MQRKHWYTHIEQTDAAKMLENHILEAFAFLPPCKKELAVLCIGTDRITGDSLGPVTGQFLSAGGCQNVWGTLDNPVHAVNLRAALKEIAAMTPRPYIIAIDASLGLHCQVGKISVKNGPIQPGAASNKDLPWIGDISITGIVNSLSKENFHSLQNTRLHRVMMMAELIAGALGPSIAQYYSQGVMEQVL